MRLKFYNDMGNMRKNNKTTSIGELIHNGAFGEFMSGAKLNTIIKHSTIFSFWSNIVGPKFSNITKPYSIKANKIYVSVKSPVIAQELSLYKTKILQKINSYSQPLGFVINDIVFNYKNYLATNPIKSNQVEDKPIFLKKEEINKVEISKVDEEKIQKTVSKMEFLNKEEKREFAKKLIDNSKAKIIQNKLD